MFIGTKYVLNKIVEKNETIFVATTLLAVSLYGFRDS